LQGHHFKKEGKDIISFSTNKLQITIFYNIKNHAIQHLMKTVVIGLSGYRSGLAPAMQTSMGNGCWAIASKTKVGKE